MKMRKRISDLQGKGVRMSHAYYRWHNQSGIPNKQSTFFECSLRDYNNSFDSNPQETQFNNTIRPLRYQKV